MRVFWKSICILSLCLLLIALPGCHQQVEAYEAVEAIDLLEEKLKR